jgi:iron complex transport system substrate-binding protein
MKEAFIYGRTRLLFACLLVMTGNPACHSPGGQHPGTSGITGEKPQYARGFWMEDVPGYKTLHVINPWQGSRSIHFQYILTDDPSRIPDSLSQHPVIQVPVKRVVCMSTTHVAMITALGESDAIVGISGSDYISNPALRAELATGEVRDVGADHTLNYELILTLRPDLVIAYGITAEVSGMVKRLEALGIPVILDGDYLEDQPLGKTEWIRFLAAFFARDKKADSIFTSVASTYEKYRDMVRNTREKPSVMTGLPWKDTWYIPGGNSFAAAYIRDAGGTYLWEDMDGREAVPLDLEAIYARAAMADLWINCGSASSLAEIGRTDRRLNRFRPVSTGRVFNNNARINPAGGNDFWESGVMAPHIILADLIRIFHPEVLPDHELVYYKLLE